MNMAPQVIPMQYNNYSAGQPLYNITQTASTASPSYMTTAFTPNNFTAYAQPPNTPSMNPNYEPVPVTRNSPHTVPALPPPASLLAPGRSHREPITTSYWLDDLLWPCIFWGAETRIFCSLLLYLGCTIIPSWVSFLLYVYEWRTNLLCKSMGKKFTSLEDMTLGFHFRVESACTFFCIGQCRQDDKHRQQRWNEREREKDMYDYEMAATTTSRWHQRPWMYEYFFAKPHLTDFSRTPSRTNLQARPINPSIDLRTHKPATLLFPWSRNISFMGKKVKHTP